MSAKYRKVDPRIWDDEQFMGLGETEKLIALYLLTSPQCNRIGYYRLSIALAAEHLNKPINSYRIAIARVLDTLHWSYDEASRVMYLRTWWKYNCPENQRHLIGCLSDIHDVPKSPLLQEFISNTAYLPAYLCDTFHSTIDSYAIAIAKGMAYQEQEQEQEQDIKIYVPDAGEQPPGPHPTESDLFLAIPLKSTTRNGAPEFHGITEADLAEYEGMFPDQDIRQTLREIAVWNAGDPTKRKTRQGIKKHIVGWMIRNNNRGVNRKGSNGNGVHGNSPATGDPFVCRSCGKKATSIIGGVCPSCKDGEERICNETRIS